MIDDAVATMAARQAEWDSLRERRVLARVEAEIDRRRAGRRWRWMPLGLVTAAVAVLIIGFAFLSSPTEVDEPPLGGLAVVVEPPLVAASWPAIPTMPAATIALVDGSTATIHYLANGSKDFPKERIEVFVGGKVLCCDNFRVLIHWLPVPQRRLCTR